MTTPMRVAALGFWHVHAGDYCRAVMDHPATELVAVWDDDVERGRAAAAEREVEFVSTLDGLLARDDIDAVTVTTSTATHHDVLLAAAQAGKHVFTEKLLAPTVEECTEIIAAADAAGVVIMVSLPFLYRGHVRAIRDHLASGALGELTYVRVRMSHDQAVRDTLPEQFYDPAAAGGGAFTDLGCHPAYLTQLFLGNDPDTVSATYRSLTGRRVEDHAVVTLGYSNQRIGVVEAGFVSRTPFTMELYGTQGALTWSARDSTLWRQVTRGAWEAVELPPHGPSPFEQWLRHIADGTRPDDNLARAVELTRLVVAADASAASGRTVSYGERS
ncbi:Gfo/Idh/MocA family protein [Propionibacteriaceae bacterium Y1685]|uniref:Gfo/Idh/MocA family protein n=1 Tax=Microlunatus sp. Y1700 TaxID=3418487 RepID=UPI003B7EDF43